MLQKVYRGLKNKVQNWVKSANNFTLNKFGLTFIESVKAVIVGIVIVCAVIACYYFGVVIFG